MTFHVFANDCDFGFINATDEQEAKDKAAQMAGYKSEADLVEKLNAPSELVAVFYHAINI